MDGFQEIHPRTPKSGHKHLLGHTAQKYMKILEVYAIIFTSLNTIWNSCMSVRCKTVCMCPLVLIAAHPKPQPRHMKPSFWNTQTKPNKSRQTTDPHMCIKVFYPTGRSQSRLLAEFWISQIIFFQNVKMWSENSRAPLNLRLD